MSNVYHQLASGSLSQDWNNTGLITANDDWSLVPSIQGFLGDIDAGSPTGVDPRTLTASSGRRRRRDRQPSAPNTLTNGGVAEFAIANPTVALNGSGTADAPSLVLYMNAAGRKDVRLSFDARDIDGSTDNAAQPLNVQYRLGASGSWTNVPAAIRRRRPGAPPTPRSHRST